VADCPFWTLHPPEVGALRGIAAQCTFGGMSKREQISIPISPDLRRYVERVAAREDRTVASAIRHILHEAARRESSTEAVGQS
jgi:hypothetical protein